MRFSMTTRPLGPITGSEPLTEYVLTNTTTGEFAAIVPEFGAILRQLNLGRNSLRFKLIQAPESAQALLADERFCSALMFPFPSRIRHGIYAFEGQEYALPMNEPTRSNAIHGFVHPEPFTVVRREATDAHALLSVQFDYGGGNIGYPFPLSLQVTYVLMPDGDGGSQLQFIYTATNTGTTRCPVAFGWHPYFTINDEPIDEQLLRLQVQQVVRLTDDMLPGGAEPVDYPDPVPLKDRQFDSPFVVGDGQATQPGAVETVLYSPKQQVRLVVGQQTGAGGLNYLVVFTPPRRDSVAIEPMSANVNAFNTGEGLAVLSPGEALSGRIWVRLESDVRF